MLFFLPRVLDPEQLSTAKALLAERSFSDGAQSAGRAARRNKRNLEYSAANGGDPVDNLIMNALLRHPVYLAAGLPRRVAAPLYARYQPGMEYGFHIDDPIMGAGDPYRSDLAITLFLAEPDDYSGGELEIDTGFGLQSVKEAAGSGIMYPATTRHRVAPVTRGERLVVVTWVQSLIADGQQRALLYQLHQARESLLQERPDDPATRQVDLSYVNLVRMWSDV